MAGGAVRAAAVVARCTGSVAWALALAFLFVPMVTIVLLSFSNADLLVFPPVSWGLRQYETFFASPAWRASVAQSFEIALPVAAIALCIGTLTVFALHRTRLPLKGWFQAVGLSPLVIPGVAYAVALYAVFVQFRIIGSVVGLVMTHVVLALPFVLLIMSAAVSRVPAELELAAMTLGASRLRAVIGITLRLSLSALGAAFIFAFITSFDDAVFVTFLAGPEIVTLPKAIYDSVRTAVDPAITAIATMIMAGNGVVMTAAMLWRR
jgi:ABC-type spermidine/putrescine transport system permease subunit II